MTMADAQFKVNMFELMNDILMSLQKQTLQMTKTYDFTKS